MSLGVRGASAASAVVDAALFLDLFGWRVFCLIWGCAWLSLELVQLVAEQTEIQLLFGCGHVFQGGTREVRLDLELLLIRHNALLPEGSIVFFAVVAEVLCLPAIRGQTAKNLLPRLQLLRDGVVLLVHAL